MVQELWLNVRVVTQTQIVETEEEGQREFLWMGSSGENERSTAGGC